LPKVANELKDIDVRRKTFGVNSAGKPVVAFHSVGGVAGLQLRCGPPGVQETRVPSPGFYVS
jgi:hypothetical protein